jgi:succinate dehydrogenase / fumarate reductase cytochrome b subunit
MAQTGQRKGCRHDHQQEKKVNFAYYPGCSAQSTCSELNVATHSVAEKLGLKLHQLYSATCTGSRELRAQDPLAYQTLNVRILALAEKLGMPLMTVCNTCTLNLLEAQTAFHGDPLLAAQINQSLAEEGLQYRGTTRITHFLWMLFEDIGEERLKAMIVRPLHGLDLAAFYGCHIVRPPGEYGFVDSRNATALERLAVLVGSRPIDYSGRVECCGFHTAAHDERIGIKLSGRHLASAKANGAMAIVTPCPLCHTVLDTLQPEMEDDLGAALDMPILHLPQLVGLALGLTPGDLKLGKHAVPVSTIKWFDKAPAAIR